MPSRNEPCPCGSGKKFKKCCFGKQFSFSENEDGSFDRVHPIDPELAKLLSEHIQSLGPDATPDTPLYGSMNAELMEHEFSTQMKKAGIDPAIIYAFEETGMLVTELNQDQFSKKDLDLWHSKILEYRNRNDIRESEFPIGTIALYGPDSKRTTKMVAAVILHADAEPILRRFVGTQVTNNPKVKAEIIQFFEENQVKKTIVTDQNIGCPHEEGEDFPVGSDCPFCPYWAGKQ